MCVCVFVWVWVGGCFMIFSVLISVVFFFLLLTLFNSSSFFCPILSFPLFFHYLFSFLLFSCLVLLNHPLYSASQTTNTRTLALHLSCWDLLQVPPRGGAGEAAEDLGTEASVRRASGHR